MKEREKNRLGKSLIRIDAAKRMKLEKICLAEVKGFSGGKLAEAFDKFRKSLFKEERALYDKYEIHVPKESSLKRLISLSEPGAVLESRFIYFKEFMELFIERHRRHWDASFKPPKASVVSLKNGFSDLSITTIGRRAGWICSFKDCLTLTGGPVLSDPYDSVELGRACLIYGVSPGEPRYDKRRRQRYDDVENGIWLCIRHSTEVDASADFKAVHLIKWKEIHERLIKDHHDGKKKITFSFNPNDVQTAEVIAIVGFIKSRPAFSGNYGDMTAIMLAGEVEDFVTFMDNLSGSIQFGSKLEQLAYAIDFTCVGFLDICRNNLADDDTARIGFSSLRKIIGLSLSEMAEFYDVELPAELLPIIPVSGNRK